MTKIFSAGNKFSSFLGMCFKHMDYMPVILHASNELRADNGSSTLPRHSQSQDFNNPFSNEDEKFDLLERAHWLINEIALEPQGLIDKMKEVSGHTHQVQWALSTCAMSIAALRNLMILYPENTNNFGTKLHDILKLMMSREFRFADTHEWHEDPLDSLAGDNSHIAYLSLLAWAMGNYRLATGDTSNDALHKDICEALVRRMKSVKSMNLPSYTDGTVVLHHMLFALLALKDYGNIHNHDYDELIAEWIEIQRHHFMDNRTGLLISKYRPDARKSRVSGTSSALNTALLCMLDPELGARQYRRFVKFFLTGNRFFGVKEYEKRKVSLSFDPNTGPLIHGVSTAATAYAIGASSVLGNWATREALLNTMDLLGKTVESKGMRHYKMSELFPVGEAVTLAMRTFTPPHFLTNCKSIKSIKLRHPAFRQIPQF